MILQDVTQNTVSFIGQLVSTIMLLVISLYLIHRSLKTDMASQRAIFKGTALFLLSCFLLDLGYVIDLYFRHLVVPGVDIYPHFADIGGPGYIYMMIALFTVACVPLIYPIEKIIMASKSMWRTKIAFIALVFALLPIVTYLFIDDINIRTILAYIGAPFLLITIINVVVVTMVLNLKLGITTRGSIREKALNVGGGFLIVFIWVVFAFAFQEISLIMEILKPIFLCFGLWLILRGENMKI